MPGDAALWEARSTHPQIRRGEVQAAHPEVKIFWYDAGHGFNCNDRASYNADAAKLARERSLDCLREHLVQ
jgi:carboxymethylenebutenolidase